MIRVEMKNVLKQSTVTVIDSDRDVFTTRTWESHYTELQRIAPVLLGILDACIPKHSSRRQCTIAGVMSNLMAGVGILANRCFPITSDSNECCANARLKLRPNDFPIRSRFGDKTYFSRNHHTSQQPK